MTFLAEPDPTSDARRLYDADVADHGHVMNLTRNWAHRPGLKDGLFALIGEAARDLDLRTRGVLVAALASAHGDSYCSLAWGARLAGAAGPETAAAVLRGTDTGLDDRERALAAWARAVARDPNGTTADDVAALRAAGLDDAGILAVTVFVALRLAFSTVNDALGARPDRELVDGAPPEVVDAVTYGRPPASG
jgi:alkylhydroperoxidase family enzyme